MSVEMGTASIETARFDRAVPATTPRVDDAGMMRTRTFTFADQADFAALSGDTNPLHLDPLAARRLLFGRAIVHGVHLLLWALDERVGATGLDRSLRSIKVQFTRPVGVNERVECRWKRVADTDEAELTSAGVTCAKVRVQWAAASSAVHKSPAAGRPEQRDPRVLADSEIGASAGELALYLDPALAAKLFPRLTARTPALQLAILATTTRLVGVECPGLNSVYFELELSAKDAQAVDVLQYKVLRHSPALALAVIQLSAPGLAGSLKAFVRPQPKDVPSYASLVDQIDPDVFRNQRALVIGGSRGLGAVTAKLLCAGGASVRITYMKGRAEAERMVEEIGGHDRDAGAAEFDVLDARGERLGAALGSWAPTHLYYFATPFIFSSAAGVFDANRFEHFCAFYVTGFSAVVAQLAPRGLRQILYPSSTALDELPINMGEYAAAKAAGEAVCKFLERSHKGMRVHSVRFPRLATDQTASLTAVKNADPVPVLLAALRGMR